MKSSDGKKLNCPFCSKGLIEYENGYGCSGYKSSGCTFFVKKTICGKRITETQLMLLVTSGRTSVIKGFISPKNGKSFDAILKVNKETKETVFEFPQKSKK